MKIDTEMSVSDAIRSGGEASDCAPDRNIRVARSDQGPGDALGPTTPLS